MITSTLAPRIGLLSLLFSLAAGQTAWADSGDAPTAVLGLEALDGAPDTVSAEITDALRQRVASTKGYQLVQGKDLVEVKLVFACADESPACMSQAGKSMGAAKLIFGNVKRSGIDYLVTLKLLDVARAQVESWVAETISKRKAEPTSFRALAPVWVAKLTGKGAAGGSLQIRANVLGAAVSLDGTRVGVTGDQPVAVADVAPGQHEVTVEKNGFTTTRQEFTLAAGQALPLSFSLSAMSVEPGLERREPLPVPGVTPGGGGVPADDSSPHSLARVGFWVAVVGTAASVGLALKFGNDVSQINKELDPLRRFQCSTSISTSGLCNSQNQQAAPLTTDEMTKVANKTADGNRAQTLQWVFVALAPPFAAVGAYLFYKGYLQTESTAEPGKLSSSHGLRIFPTASASAGGIIAEFDF
jgi:PEGA domain